MRRAAWDPYPFILLNLILSLLAAIQAPVIMMSQNGKTGKTGAERTGLRGEPARRIRDSRPGAEAEFARDQMATSRICCGGSEK